MKSDLKIMSECKCAFQQRLIGDGCEICNPEKALEYAYQTITDLEERLREIGNYAHQHSTGPAVPDALWAVREMAYELI
jgi:hypothetical protein